MTIQQVRNRLNLNYTQYNDDAELPTGFRVMDHRVPKKGELWLYTDFDSFMGGWEHNPCKGVCGLDKTGPFPYHTPRVPVLILEENNSEMYLLED